MTLWLSRLTLSRTRSIEALKRLLDPTERGRSEDAHHRLLWSAFAVDPDARRNFLWRSERDGVFHVLSPQPPEPSPFFERPQIKEFAPALEAGDRLDFVLRANATRTRKTLRDGKERRVHDDIVMHAIRDVAHGVRPEVRMDAAARVANDWLSGQGARGGFALERAEVGDYSVVVLPGHRGPRKGQPQFGVLDLTGVIRVTDPERLIQSLGQGFGRAKAFGHGLMMIRRAR